MRKLSLPDRAFGDLLKYILDDNITDINWSRELWINHLEKGRYKVNNFKLDDIFINNSYYFIIYFLILYIFLHGYLQ